MNMARTVFLNGPNKGGVEVPRSDVQVLLVPLLVGPRHVLVRDALPERHVPPLPRGLRKPVAVMLHLTLLFELIDGCEQRGRLPFGCGSSHGKGGGGRGRDGR